MVVESHIKRKNVPSSTDLNQHRFEQRAPNEELKASYYFNQPSILFPIKEENKEILKDMINKMVWDIDDCGMGLAHNQLEQKNNAQNPYAICVIRYKSDVEEENVPFEAFINPLVVGYDLKKTKFPHGCLSALEYPRGDIATYSEIIVAYYTEELNEIKVKKFINLAAIIIQHELRHIFNSDTYFDEVLAYFKGDKKLLEQYFFNSNFRLEQVQKALTEQTTMTEEQKKLYQNFKVHEVDEIPCLMTSDILSRCKNFLQNNKLYSDAVQKYLENHPEDRLLYENLMRHQETDLPLYGINQNASLCESEL